MPDHSTPDAGEWKDWAEVAAADLADPAFRALVEENDVDQQEWARQYRSTPGRAAPRSSTSRRWRRGSHRLGGVS